MTSSCCRFARLLIGLALFAQTAGAAEAPAADRDPALALTAGHLEWRVPEGAAGAVLTLIGPDDFLLRKVYEAAPVLTFSAADLTGEAFADGTYTWELRFVAATDAAPPSSRRGAGSRRRGRGGAAARTLRRPTPIEPLAGSFRVGGGAIVAPVAAASDVRAAVSPARTLDERDQVIPDDLIVQGSTCVGLRLRQWRVVRLRHDPPEGKQPPHQVRGHLDGGPSPPTTGSSPPTTRRAAGRTSSPSRTSPARRCRSRSTAGATTNSLFVDSTGRVGFRTATPVLDLHVDTSNTPGLRLEQNSSGGFTAQTWDIAGNEANFFVRDVTGGSRAPVPHPAGRADEQLDRHRRVGQVGIGDGQPQFRIDAAGSNLRGRDDLDHLRPMPNASDGARFLARRARGYGRCARPHSERRPDRDDRLPGLHRQRLLRQLGDLRGIGRGELAPPRRRARASSSTTTP